MLLNSNIHKFLQQAKISNTKRNNNKTGATFMGQFNPVSDIGGNRSIEEDEPIVTKSPQKSPQQ